MFEQMDMGSNTSPMKGKWRLPLGGRGLLWKTDFARRYLEVVPHLGPVRERRCQYFNEPKGLEDQMFLLEKRI